MTYEPGLVARSLPDKDRETHILDMHAAAKKTIDGLKVPDPMENGGTILFGQLVPFYQAFEKKIHCVIREVVQLSRYFSYSYLIMLAGISPKK